jgi:hypothetical protein
MGAEYCHVERTDESAPHMAGLSTRAPTTGDLNAKCPRTTSI